MQTTRKQHRLADEIRQPVRGESDVLRARSIARETAERLGFDGIRTASVEIAVSELGLNLIKHKTVGSVLLIRTLYAGQIPGVEIVSEDHGPGMADPLRAMEDGYSTAGSLGIGLSGIRRLMDEFHMEQLLPLGTRICVRKWLHSENSPRLGFSVFNRPAMGEKQSGDLFFIKQHVDFGMFGIVDALGHGKEAHAVATRAILHLEHCFEQPMEDIFSSCHDALRGTRGAAMALARVDNTTRQLSYLSIGNIELVVLTGACAKRLPGRYGTLGASYAQAKVQNLPLPTRAAIIMHSDGIEAGMELPQTLLLMSAQEIALHIFEKHTKMHDDATVIVGKMLSSSDGLG
ncbi:ATP-binding SpoIIE family protein phosphatase [Megalodesulfovibrio gigas]|uniref:Putative anti-sigma regulatory factor, serine/threonine protein kinase n=1 Tax=Megalodesulfovibrio gigas (strain ATCC 19364 / DSM 1382 / NCIMB 9332 / VKM B-1759) TaxID=1121448 RepID=T2GF70_MEGG1|nr:ATP-binding SpoIIE family protein phosphatase [Megalodesulfovibrio gigas]AGW14938.1 putative anti-sigma regulatory factor, serine/threonine protein kinase [Megalodesulfovibrio gigas DSM 1382 = ATCC 19364]